MRDFGSMLRGLLAMPKWYVVLKHWTIRFTIHGQFWAHWWTPIWHEGRGPYISLGLGPIRIYRGY